MGTLEADALFPDEQDLGVASARDRDPIPSRTPPPIQVISLNQEDAAAFAEEIALDQIRVKAPRLEYAREYAPRERDAARPAFVSRAVAFIGVLALLVALSIAAVAGLWRIAQLSDTKGRSDVAAPAAAPTVPAEASRREVTPVPPPVDPAPSAAPTVGAEPPPEPAETGESSPEPVVAKSDTPRREPPAPAPPRAPAREAAREPTNRTTPPLSSKPLSSKSPSTPPPVRVAPEVPSVGTAGALPGSLGRTVTLPSPPPAPAAAPEPAVSNPTAPIAAPEPRVSTPPATAPASEPAVRNDPPPAPAIDQSAAIRATLSRYAAGYTDLDAGAVSAVWPTVDRAGLKRAFASLDSQKVTLDSCDVRVNGATGRATCAGTATWVPKIGGKSRQQIRTWNFVLKNAAGGWQIVTADVR